MIRRLVLHFSLSSAILASLFISSARADLLYFTDTTPGLEKLGYVDLATNQITYLNVVGAQGRYGPTVDTVNGKIYFSDLFSQKIFSVNMDGSGLTAVISIPQGRQIALDIAGGKMYFASEGISPSGYTDFLYRANLDGSGVETLVGGLWNPRGVALDLENGKVYFSSFDLAMQQMKIQRANLDGSNVEFVAWTQGASNWNLAIDTVNDYLYWANGVERTVLRSGLDGSNVTVLMSGVNMMPFGIEVDPNGGSLYVGGVFHYVDNLPGSGGLIRSNLDGSNLEFLFTNMNFGGLDLVSTPLATVPEPSSLTVAALFTLGFLAFRKISKRRRAVRTDSGAPGHASC